MICNSCGSEVPDLSKFCLHCGADLRAESREPATLTLESEEREDSGEYRYLSVMFIDLVGSTRLSEKLPAEAYRRLILRYRQICVGPIRRFGGYVARYLGDGILVYFGYPNSFEDNAARACHAAIEIHEAFEEKAGEAFRDSGIRIGIHSGRVLISTIDDGEIKESHAIVGRAPNLAARLQDAAQVNQTVVSRAVRQLLGELFQLSSLGVRELKGIAEPVDLYSLDARGDQSAATAGAERSPLVEREREKEQLMQKWAGLKDFQILAVMDQSGIGKSALIQWFLDTLEAEKIQPLTMTCSPYEERSPFMPIIRSLEKISGADLVENPEDRTKAYDTFLEELGLDHKEARAALKHFVGLEDPRISRAYSEDPEGLRTHLVSALVSFFTMLGKGERQLLVLEETMEFPLHYGAFEDLRYRRRMADVDLMAQEAGGFDPRQRTMWIEVENLLGEETCLAPFEAFHADFTLPALPGSGMFLCNTNGLASGNNTKEALVHALCELIERDAETLWHLRPDAEAQARALDLSSGLPPESAELLDQSRAAGIEAYVWDLSSDIGLPVFQCMLLSSEEDGTDPEFGLGCHPSREVALSRAITEALQVRLTVIAGSRDDLLASDYCPIERQARLEQARQLCRGANEAPRSFRYCPHFDNELFSEDIGLVLGRLTAIGVEEVLVADLTKEAFQIPVVRAAVPGLEAPWEVFDPEAPLSPRAQRAMAGAA